MVSSEGGITPDGREYRISLRFWRLEEPTEPLPTSQGDRNLHSEDLPPASSIFRENSVCSIHNRVRNPTTSFSEE